MMQQVQQPCGACGQTGYSVPASDKCGACGGKGLLPEKKVFDVHIAKVGLEEMTECCSAASLEPGSEHSHAGCSSWQGLGQRKPSRVAVINVTIVLILILILHDILNESLC